MIKVMIVDDEPGFATTLAERLELREISADTANSGRAAMELLPTVQPDVVLLDLSLPDMNGLKVLKLIKEFDETIEVVILTGKLACEVDGRQKEAFCCMSKPVELADLLVVIKDAHEARTMNTGG